MMSTTKVMVQTLPNHVLRVGQTIRVDSAQDSQHPTLTQSAGDHGDNDLDISLDNLNQLIMELDPSFNPIQPPKSPTCTSPPQDDSYSNEDAPHYKLVPRGCAPRSSPTLGQSLPPSSPIPVHSSPIPVHSSRSYSPHGSVVFSSSPTFPQLLSSCGSSPRRNPSQRNDSPSSQGSLRVLPSNRNSATSLHSMSTCSDTSYIFGSNLSLTSEDTDSSPEALVTCTPSFCSDASRMRTFESRGSPERPSPTKQELFKGLNSEGPQSSPASPFASLTNIPVVLVNGVPLPDPHHHHFSPTETVSNSRPLSPHSFQAHLHGSQPSMKFVSDTSRFWFHPHISRAEAEALVKDKESGSFVVRDSTSYKGSFGLAMKVEQAPTDFIPNPYPGETSPEVVRHFLIESSLKGVRIKGSSHEPYFGSLSALVYHHTISAYGLPHKLLLPCQDLSTAGKASGKPSSEDKKNTACNFVYLNAVSTEMLTGPCAVQRAVSFTLENAPAFRPTIINMKVCLKGVTLTDVSRKLFFRRHYPAQLISYSGEDPDNRVWVKGSSSGCRARMFGFVARGAEASMENVCHVFAEYDSLQPCTTAIDFIQAAIVKG